MKAVVFGGTGFIGGHVVEQLHFAGHNVMAVVRQTSDTTFLDSLGIRVCKVDFFNPVALGSLLDGYDVVYNCTADTKSYANPSLDAAVEIQLTRTLIQQAGRHHIKRFVQLSSVVVCDFHANEPIDESYESKPEFDIQAMLLKREKIVREEGRIAGIQTVILRPASTIGARDKTSFFTRLLAAHNRGTYPIVDGGTTKASMVDTRDIGRAMVYLGEYPAYEVDCEIFFLKGFDTTWIQLKKTIDEKVGYAAGVIELPKDLSVEQMRANNLSPLVLKNYLLNRVWNDNKIRRLGFTTKYGLADAVESAVRDERDRVQ